MAIGGDLRQPATARGSRGASEKRWRYGVSVLGRVRVLTTSGDLTAGTAGQKRPVMKNSWAPPDCVDVYSREATHSWQRWALHSAGPTPARHRFHSRSRANQFSGYMSARSRVPSEIGGHFRAQANFSVRSSFFSADSALSASGLLAKACAPSTRTGGLERVNFAPLPLL